MRIFDRGGLEIKEREEGKIVFDMKGARLNGTYALVRLKGQGKRDDNWLLMRTK